MCYKSLFVKSKSAKAAQHSPTLDKDKAEIAELNLIPFVNRCIHVVCDKKGRNFFALQYHPNTNMRYYPSSSPSVFSQDMQVYMDEYLNQIDENFNTFSCVDNFISCPQPQQPYDTEIKLRGNSYFVNKFILLSRCPKFFLKLNLFECKEACLDVYFQKYLYPQLFELVLKFIYTGNCSLQLVMPFIKKFKLKSAADFLKFLSELKEFFVEKFSFVELKSSFDQGLKAYKQADFKSVDERIDALAKLLADILNKKKLKFNRHSYEELHDCQIECNNEQSLSCHKCILIARCEYFRNMFLGSWMESSQSVIRLPCDLDLMQILVDYLYTDDIQMEFIHAHSNTSGSIKSKNEREVEVLFNLFILSDQFLLERLKKVCEFKLANLVNLKNSVEIFEFSHQYEANQLKDFCMEFISCNLVTLIEAKQLENTELDLLRDLSKFYRSYFELVGSRIITPYATGLDTNSIELIPLELLYDQKFVDGSLEEDYIVRRKVLNPVSPSPNEVINQIEQVQQAIPAIISTEKEFDSSVINQKWEKVKKKVCFHL